MISNSQIRQNARTQLKGNLGLLIGVLIVYSVIYSLASSTGVGAIVLAGPLLLGVTWHVLNVKRNGKGEFGDLFKGFNNFGTALVTELLREIYMLLWSLLFIIPGIVKSFSYALTMYILHDNPNMSANEAITLSRKMMNGNKGKLFALELSFIGWHILGLLTFGILEIVYVTPYQILAETNFYDEVKAEYEKANGITSAQSSAQTPVQNNQGAAQSTAQFGSNFCEKCGARVNPGAKFCTVCGSATVSVDPNACKNCGAKLEPGSAFCPNCGNKVNQ